MPDIFDEIAQDNAGGGDIFDEIAPDTFGDIDPFSPDSRNLRRVMENFPNERAQREWDKPTISREEHVKRSTWRELGAGDKLAADLTLSGPETGFKSGVAGLFKGLRILEEHANPTMPQAMAEDFRRIRSAAKENRTLTPADMTTPAEAAQMEAEWRQLQSSVTPEQLQADQDNRTLPGRIARRIEATIPESPQPSNVSRPIAAVGNAAGSLASSMMFAPLGPAGVTEVMFLMELSDAYDSEMARQQDVGEPLNPDKAFLKANLYAPGSAALEYIGGAGRLARRWFGLAAEQEVKELARRGGPAAVLHFFKARATDAAAEGGTEALQRLYQDAIVMGKPNLAAALIEGGSAAGGSLLLGGLSMGARLGGHKANQAFVEARQNQAAQDAITQSGQAAALMQSLPMEGTGEARVMNRAADESFAQPAQSPVRDIFDEVASESQAPQTAPAASDTSVWNKAPSTPAAATPAGAEASEQVGQPVVQQKHLVAPPTQAERVRAELMRLPGADQDLAQQPQQPAAQPYTTEQALADLGSVIADIKAKLEQNQIAPQAPAGQSLPQPNAPQTGILETPGGPGENTLAPALETQPQTPAPPALSTPAKPVTPPVKRKSPFVVRPRPDGVPDILDAIQEAGGMAPLDSAVYGNWRDAFTGPARMLIRKGGRAADKLVDDLSGRHAREGEQAQQAQTFRVEKVDDIIEAVRQAVAVREKLRDTGGGEDAQAERSWTAISKQPTQTGGLVRISADQLQPGDKFRLRGPGHSHEELEVRSVANGVVTLKDGKAFGWQEVPEGTEFWAQKKGLELAAAPEQSGGTDDKSAGNAGVSKGNTAAGPQPGDTGDAGADRARGRLERDARAITGDSGLSIVRIAPGAIADQLRSGRTGAGGVEAIAKLFRTRVVWFRQTGTTNSTKRINGWTDTTGKFVFLNVATPQPHLAILGHELIHTLSARNPALYAELIQALRPLYRNLPEYDALKRGIGYKGSLEAIEEEFIADFAASQFNTPAFWERLHDQNPSVFKRTLNRLLSYLDKLIGQLTGKQYQAEQWFSDVTAAREVLAGALAQYAAGNNGSNPAAAQAEAGLIRGSAAEKWADEVIANGKQRLHAGLDPELLVAYVVKGTAILESGIRDVAEWSKAMVSQFGEAIRPHLQNIFNQATSTRWQAAKTTVTEQARQALRGVPPDFSAIIETGRGNGWNHRANMSNNASNALSAGLMMEKDFKDWLATHIGVPKKAITAKALSWANSDAGNYYIEYHHVGSRVVDFYSPGAISGSPKFFTGLAKGMPNRRHKAKAKAAALLAFQSLRETMIAEGDLGNWTTAKQTETLPFWKRKHPPLPMEWLKKVNEGLPFDRAKQLYQEELAAGQAAAREQAGRDKAEAEQNLPQLIAAAKDQLLSAQPWRANHFDRMKLGALVTALREANLVEQSVELARVLNLVRDSRRYLRNFPNANAPVSGGAAGIKTPLETQSQRAEAQADKSNIAAWQPEEGSALTGEDPTKTSLAEQSGSLRNGQSVSDGGRFSMDDLFGAPESVAEQKERLKAEAEAAKLKKAKETMRERAGARLTGKDLDTTKEMFGAEVKQDKAGQGSLFSVDQDDFDFRTMTAAELTAAGYHPTFDQGGRLIQLIDSNGNEVALDGKPAKKGGQADFDSLQEQITAAEAALKKAIRQHMNPPQGMRKAEALEAKNAAASTLHRLMARQLKQMTSAQVDAARSPEQTAELIGQTVHLLNSIQDEISERTARSQEVLGDLTKLRQDLQTRLNLLKGWADDQTDEAAQGIKPTSNKPETLVSRIRYMEIEGATNPSKLSFPYWHERFKKGIKKFLSPIPELPLFGDRARFTSLFKRGYRLFAVENNRVKKEAAEKVKNVLEPLAKLNRTPADNDALQRYYRLAEKLSNARKAGDETRVTALAEQLHALETTVLNKDPFNLFRRLVLYRDFYWRGTYLKNDEGKPIALPGGLTPDEVLVQLRRITKAITEHPDGLAITEALRRHYALMEELRQSILAHGEIIPEALNNPTYFPHLLTEYYSDNLGRVNPTTEESFRKYLITPVGSERLIQTDYIKAVLQHTAEVLSHNARADLVEKYWQSYDISEQLKEQHGDKWDRAFNLPPGYSLYAPYKKLPLRSTYILSRDVLAKQLGVLFNDGDLRERMAGKVVKVKPEDLRTAMVAGEKIKWALPTEIVDALHGIEKREAALANQPDHAGAAAGKVVRRMMNYWKQLKLFGPTAFARYSFGNLTTDAIDKVLVADPKTAGYMRRAARELWRADQGEQTPEFKAASREGVFETITAGEVGKLEKLPEFREFMTTGQVRKAKADKVAGAPAALNSFRESTFRYAKFLADVERLRAGEEIPFTGMYHKDIDALGALPNGKKAVLEGEELIYAKAAENSLRHFGDYNMLAVNTQWLRRYIMPFVSWTDVNLRYHVSLAANMVDAFRPGATELHRTHALRVSGAKIAMALAFVGVAKELWNQFGGPLLGLWDDEDDLENKLSPHDRRRAHIILGKDAKGEVMVMYTPSAFGDVAEWVGGQNFKRLFFEYARGDITLDQWISDYAKQLPVDFGNKLVQSTGPVIKGPYELASDKATFPDIFDQRTIPKSDKWWRFVGTMTDDRIANWVRGVFDEDYYNQPMADQLQQIVLQVRRRDPQSWAYYEIKEQAAEWEFAKTGKRFSQGDYTAPEAMALRNFRRAIYRGDVAAADQFYHSLLRYGYTAERLDASIRNQAPLAGLNLAQQKEFKASMDARTQQQLALAEQYYAKLKALDGREKQLFPKAGKKAEPNPQLLRRVVEEQRR